MEHIIGLFDKTIPNKTQTSDQTKRWLHLYTQTRMQSIDCKAPSNCYLVRAIELTKHLIKHGIEHDKHANETRTNS